MPVGAPGTNSRGRGGKFKKYTRGGGHHFSRDLQPVDQDGNLVSMWSKDANKGEGEDDEDDDEEDSSEEEDSDDAGPAAATGDTSRQDRKAEKKARKEAALAKAKAHNVEVGDLPTSDEDSDDEALPANPNHSKAARAQTVAPAPGAEDEDDVDKLADGVAGVKMPQSRREREAVEAQIAKQKYQKLHAAGKTDEAKADMARLSLIREQRAADTLRRQAEKEEKDEAEKTRKAEIDTREAKRREAAAAVKKGGKKK